MIYRALSQTEWKQFLEAEIYSPADLGLEGFIHASGCEEDVIEVLNRRYPDVPEMLVIGIDETLISEVVKWEKAPDDTKPGRLFPHIYSPLSLLNVVCKFEIERNSSGEATQLSRPLGHKTVCFYSVNQPYGEFSNFSNHGVSLEDLWWMTTEHYFQAMKFEDAAYREKIRVAKTPAQAAKLGRSRSVALRDDWEDVKDEVMKTAVRKKFETHPALAKLLLSTGDAEIVENAPGDFYWGCGKDGTGKNRLGEILMLVRRKLQK